MFTDNTLTPKEAVRLCALGMVAGGPLRYAALADSVRHFCGRVMGPSLDLMGSSIELLRYEGLVTAVDGTGMEDDALLAITEAGRTALESLLTAAVRPSTDLTKLLVALKFRFFPLLTPEARAGQIDMLIDVCDSELARLEDLRAGNATDGPALQAWLDLEIGQLRARLRWLEAAEFLKTDAAPR
jgi:DNA-binding PadR family transcriptional regulator